MKVVFLEDVPGTARVGEVREVRNGFARNFLLPRTLAAPATVEMLKRAEVKAKAEERKQSALDNDARSILARIGEQPLTIRARVGEQGRLYGSVTAADIAEELSKLTKEEFDRRRIELAEPIREAGEHEVTLRLTRNVHGTVKVLVEPEQ
ncbi:MAG TPA: 50S ribosomal protein L9 [Steroidobacteraceae bacterium]|nr:50S ribosomal protein L9 [Steroidobacteraceae bacterium]